MSDTTLLLVLSTALLILAGVIIATASGVSDRSASVTTPSPITRERVVRGVWAGAFAIVVLAVSGWVVPSLVIGAAAWFWVAAFQRRDRRHAQDIERTDALASWIENLRDVLLAGDQPIGAIASTVPSAPPIIRPAVRRLSAALGHQAVSYTHLRAHET